jgi:DNA-binding response OmpR family regulator
MKRRILIVDDEPRWLDFARRDLAGQYEVDTATDTPTALDKILIRRYDLVIVSARRLDAVERIRHKHADQPIIVTTLQQTTQEAARAYRLGAARYFSKSFGPSDLYRRVCELIPIAAPSFS